MFCAKCGAVLQDNARKCDQCGAPVRIRPNRAESRGSKGKGSGARSAASDLPIEKDIEKALQQEESFMDPVFFEEAGGDVDVDAIIKIARGEDPDDGKGAWDSKEAGGNTLLSARDPEFDEPVFEEPEEEEPELNMETYLAGLPLIEKVRRKIRAGHNSREEASDQRRMKMHLERASRHFSKEENAAVKAEELRLEEARRRREEARARAESQQEEKRRAEAAETNQTDAKEAKATANPAEAKKAEAAAHRAEAKEAKAGAGRAETERAAAARQQEEKISAEKAEAERAEVLRLQEEIARRREEADRAERIAAAARQKERARAGAMRRQNAQAPAESAPEQEREGLEVIRLHGRDFVEESLPEEEEAAAAAAPRQEAELAAQAARLQEDKGAGEAGGAKEAKEAKTAFGRTQAHSARKELQREEKARLQKILSTDSEEYDSYRRLDSTEGKELTARERQMEELRRLRKVRSNQADRFDEYLGRYGLTKETAVRIATLFLIVLLSVIYVLGRGGSNTSPDLSNAGTGTTGIESAQDQTGDQNGTEAGQETQVPTGGGDFGNN